MLTALQPCRPAFIISVFVAPTKICCFRYVNGNLQLTRQYQQAGNVVLRLSVSLQESPASTSTLTFSVDSTVQFPRLPLARTVIRIAIPEQHNRNRPVEGIAKVRHHRIFISTNVSAPRWHSR
jgi:hypothetical protein